MFAGIIRSFFQSSSARNSNALLQERSHPDLLRSRADGPIVLFDGPCHLCRASVRFILKWERTAELRVASLQSDLAKELLKRHGLCAKLVEGTEVADSLVFIENGRGYLRSSAALRLTSYLRFPWNMLRVFLLLPPFLRDGVYDFIAAHRYRWFGRDGESCSL